MANDFMKTIQDVHIGPGYYLVKLLGSGTFGKVYLGKNISSNDQVAIKLEHYSVYISLLDEEATAYEALVGLEGFPQILWLGNKHDYRCLVMELLGSNLEDLFQYCGGVFSLKTTLMLADQLLLRFEALHSTGYLHRDLKPENFLLGTKKNGNTVYMTDLGLATSRLPDINKPTSKTSSSRKPCLIGTCRYASIQGHIGIGLSQKDDLEALGYMLIYFLKGKLPWQGLHCHRDIKEQSVLQMKEETSAEDLCRGFPAAFEVYMHYVRDLAVSAKPDYDYLRDLFRTLSKQRIFAADQIFDWTLLEFARRPRPPTGRSKDTKRVRLPPKLKEKQQQTAKAR